MKRYIGCISPTERRKRACEDWECRQQKKSFSFSSGSIFGGKWSVEWRAEQPTGTAQRNKVNDRRETFCLPLMLNKSVILDSIYRK
jgi:hypothetical protein